METDVMIRQLRREAKKHENDVLHTFDTNITSMCTDVANRLEELMKEINEIRNKTIDEFAGRLHQLCGVEIGNLQYTDILHEGRIDEIAREMKGYCIEIDCRQCTNCTGSSCKVYGDDVNKAVNGCASDGFKNYNMRVGD